MRPLKITLTVEDPATHETLIVTGDLNVLRDLVGGVKIILPHYNQSDESEAVNTFLEESRAKIDLIDRTCRMQAQPLYDLYAEWCVRTNHKPLSSTKLAREWVRLGFEKQIINGLKYWTGIQIGENDA